MLKFRYATHQHSNNIRKPTIEIELKGSGQFAINTIGLLDSGADVTVIPIGLAKFLDLKLGEEDIAHGIGGDIKVWNSHVNMRLRQDNTHENYELKNVPVQVTEMNTIPVIFGRAKLFEEFQILIDERKQLIRLKKNTSIIS